MNPEVHSRIASLLSANHVVLFMKGNPQAPRCGFSAKAAGLLGSVAPGFVGVDVLADEELRQGIKEYGNWPTIPQLYVGGELIGGSDIIAQMHASGELHQLLGAAPPERVPAPAISISDQAAAAIRAGMADDPGLSLHLQIDGMWQAQFQLAPAEGHEIRASANGIDILLDPESARRASGMVIDWVERMSESGLSVHLPLAPARVRSLSVKELRDKLAAGALRVLDVRPPADRARASIAGTDVLDQQSFPAFAALPKSQPLAFLCHHGNSSRQAAEQFRALGFTEIYNVEGGIDAWSLRIDPAVARY